MRGVWTSRRAHSASHPGSWGPAGVGVSSARTAAAGRCSRRIARPRATIAACSMAFRSSRMFPTQGRDAEFVEELVAEADVGDVGQAGLAQEMLGQGRDVFATVAKRRDVDGEDAEAEEQVFAELAGRHELVERPVRRRDDPDIGGPRPGIADRRHRAVLDDAQELHLEVRRDVADLIQQHRSAAGQLEEPFLVLDRAGE